MTYKRRAYHQLSQSNLAKSGRRGNLSCLLYNLRYSMQYSTVLDKKGSEILSRGVSWCFKISCIKKQITTVFLKVVFNKGFPLPLIIVIQIAFYPFNFNNSLKLWRSIIFSPPLLYSFIISVLLILSPLLSQRKSYQRQLISFITPGGDGKDDRR